MGMLEGIKRKAKFLPDILTDQNNLEQFGVRWVKQRVWHPIGTSLIDLHLPVQFRDDQ